MEVYAVQSISSIKNEHIERRKAEFSHLKGLWFSDVCKDKEQLEVDILIGSDYLWCFQVGGTRRGELHEPVAVETKLGWVLSGPMKGERKVNEVHVNFVGHSLVIAKKDSKQHENLKELGESVQKLWDYETVGIREEENVHDTLKERMVFNGTRYIVELPWKEGHERLSSNYWNSLQRLKAQVRRLQQEPEILVEYDRVIKEQLEKGIIEPICDLESEGKLYYLPHHPVIRKDAKTTKLRVVYETSAKPGVSLNDCLHVGPALTPMLYDVLIRFREKRVAEVGDIEKAFLNVEVAEKDRDSLRFLWVEDVNAKVVNPVEYRFCRTVFGVNCSPFLLNATIQHHLDTFSDEDPKFVQTMKKSLYVDDWVGSHSNPEDAIKLFDVARSHMMKGGFRLRKWLTNDPEVRSEMRKVEFENGLLETENEEQTFVKETIGPTEVAGKEKVLGMLWDRDSDEFIYFFSKIVERMRELIPTKRNILSILASLYDLLGVISPIVVSLKVLFQELCVDKAPWDQELTGERCKEWKGWMNELERVKEIKIPRCVYGLGKEAVKCSLVGFADASQSAYCADIYFVSESMGKVNVTLLTSKTRVTPVNAQTIPRLELMAARTLAQLMDTVRNALAGEVEIDHVRYFSDSKTVLCWIADRNGWKVFVKHRVNEILTWSKKEDWGYCPSAENPADVGSRGVGAHGLMETELWWNGPRWLRTPGEGFPTPPVEFETEESSLEMKKSCVLKVSIEETSNVECIMAIEKFSSLNRLYRVTAYVRKFIYNLRAKQRGVQRKNEELGRDEMIGAERMWTLAAQARLKNQDNYAGLVKELRIVEYNGLLKCRGRLNNSDLSLEGKQPTILPRDHCLTKLIINDCHNRVFHSGLRSTLAELRSRFWVPRGRQKVKNIIRDCGVCRKIQ